MTFYLFSVRLSMVEILFPCSIDWVYINDAHNKMDGQIGFTPFLVVNDATAAIKFYIAAFGAVELERYEGERVIAKLAIDRNEFWLGDEEPEFDNYSAKTIGDSPVRFVLTVGDPDLVFAGALAAGAIEICPVRTEESWKIGKLADPFGHIWEIGHPLLSER